MSQEPRLRVSLFGAPGSNLNLGLNALMHGTIAAASVADPGVEFTVFDNELGVRRGRVMTGSGPVAYASVGARRSRRVHRPESFAAMTASLLVRGAGNPGATAVLRSNLVLDVSGGDSFSDIYGPHRFRTVCDPKVFAGRAGRPLVLLPQTYGPFRSVWARDRARALILQAEQAWARDPDSLDVLSELLGDDFDRDRHRLGVDLAMLLPAGDVDASDPAVAVLARSPVGVNVSGLLWTQPESFGLRLDYREAMRTMVVRLVEDGYEVVLVPHVLGKGAESDSLAGDELRSGLATGVAQHVHTVSFVADAGQAKAVISRCAFFIGTRMHSAIAALSSGVPCCAIAYSPKYRGVFATVGVASSVLDARSLSTAGLVEAVLARHADAAATEGTLRRVLPAVRRDAASQMRQILAAADQQ